MKSLLKRYVTWTYGLFYCFILVIGLTMLVLKAQTLAEIIKVVSAWTSTFVFIAMFKKIYPKETLMVFIKKQFSERIKVSTLISIILVQSFIFLGSLLVTSSVQHVPLKTQITTSWLTLLVLFGDNLIRGPLGEELGWRGFVLNELQKKYSPLKSAIIVGVVWGLWHTPLWFLSGYAGLQLVQYIVCFMVSIVSFSIILTVFYNWNHNLFIPIILHQLFNYLLVIQTGDILRNITVTTAFYFVAAVILVWVNYRKCLYGDRSFHNRSQNNKAETIKASMHEI